MVFKHNQPGEASASNNWMLAAVQDKPGPFSSFGTSPNFCFNTQARDCLTVRQTLRQPQPERAQGHLLDPITPWPTEQKPGPSRSFPKNIFLSLERRTQFSVVIYNFCMSSHQHCRYCRYTRIWHGVLCHPNKGAHTDGCQAGLSVGSPFLLPTSCGFCLRFHLGCQVLSILKVGGLSSRLEN